MNNSCKIMIVDDEFIMRQGIKFMIKWEENGYEVVGEASNGKEALNLIAELKPHIILCDIAMPVMNGLDFIKIAANQYPNIKIIVLSGYDNFDYVRNSLINGAVDYVLKPTLTPEELLKILQRVIKTIPGLHIKPNINKVNILEQYLLYENEQIPKFNYDSFRLLVFPLKYSDKNSVSLYSVLYEKITEFLKNLACDNMSFLYNNDKLCAVLNYPLEKDSEIFYEINLFIKKISDMCENIFVVISQTHSSIKDIKQDFKNPNFLKYERFYFKKCNLYLADNLNNNIFPDKFDYRKFITFVNNKKYGDARDLMHDYILKAIYAQIPSIKLKNQTKNFLYNLVGETDESEVEEIYIKAFDEIENAQYSDDFIKIVESILDKLVNILSKDKQATDEYMEKILDYIKQNYKEDLTLQSLAEQFNFGYSYLSAYFAQYAHEGFSEYLNKIRIQKACQMLKDSKYSIAEVSFAVGYSDHSYFCRVFKKITGITPSLYRKGN